MQRKGLTLTELLVVIGITVLLLGFFLPIYDEVRWKARLISCVSNLKQIGLALRMYIEDWNGYTPPFTNCLPAGEYYPKAVEPKLMEAAYIPYLRKGDIWFCSQDPFMGRHTDKSSTHEFTSYEIRCRYAVPILAANPPLIVPPFEKPYAFFPEQMQCVICMGAKKAHRWIYAIDLNHSRVYRKTVIWLLLNGRVVVRTARWDSNLHECPAKQLPPDWPFHDWP